MSLSHLRADPLLVVGLTLTIALRSSANFAWPWSSGMEDPEQVFGRTYPSVLEWLNQFREAAIKRTDKGKFWWEMRSCDYWDAFEAPKIVWPDISKLPRFSMDLEGRYMGNTGYFLQTSDYYVLGVLSSWATWFFISKTSQPLRLRGDRWQYRLFTQSMENVPIPQASEAERQIISDLSRTCTALGLERYRGQVNVRRRLSQAFGNGILTPLNQKAEAWWKLPLNLLGEALKESFKVSVIATHLEKTGSAGRRYGHAKHPIRKQSRQSSAVERMGS